MVVVVVYHECELVLIFVSYYYIKIFEEKKIQMNLIMEMTKITAHTSQGIKKTIVQKSE